MASETLSLVIDPATRIPETDCFNALAPLLPGRVSYHLPVLAGFSSLPRRLDAVAACVVLGSGASVHDPLPWQSCLRGYLRQLIAQQVPLLGLCYGHQLIAALLGGEVAYLHADRRKVRGEREVPIPGFGRGPMVVSHREIVTRAPASCVAWGASDEFGIEALRHRTAPIMTIQAHPEATPVFLHNQAITIPEDSRALAHGRQFLEWVWRSAIRTAPGH